MTYKDVSNGETEDYRTNQQIYTDLLCLLRSVRNVHGQLILDPEDQKGVMPSWTPKSVLDQIATNIANDDVVFSSWEEKISGIMSRIPEDKISEIIDPYPPKVPWYRKCFFCGCCK